MSRTATAPTLVSFLADVGPTQLIPETVTGHHRPVLSGAPLGWQPLA